MIRLFTYGTLKRGFHNHHFLEGATFIHAQRYWGLKMFNYHDMFPVCQLLENYNLKQIPVAGEIYQWDHHEYPNILPRLDQLEGEGNFYKRAKVPGTDTIVYVGLPQAFNFDTLPEVSAIKGNLGSVYSWE